MKGLKFITHSFPTFAILTLALAMTAAGCSGRDREISRSSGNEEYLNDDFNTGKEQPGFGDPEIQAMTEDMPYDDPFDTAKKSSAGTGAEFYYIRIVWGNLVVDTDETEWRDYSGQMTIDDGTLVIERTVAFDPGDSEIENREDPMLVAWTSRTHPHYDGLVVRIEPGALPDEENVLHIVIGPYEKDYTLAGLADIVLIEPTGAGDDNVAMAAHYGNDENSGFLNGRWRKGANGRGVFKGKWETSSGELIGHERGHYVPQGDGQGLIRGKAIDESGNFLALLDGEYQDTSAIENAGEFAIDFLDADRAKTGEADGVYLKESDKNVGFALANYFAE